MDGWNRDDQAEMEEACEEGDGVWLAWAAGRTAGQLHYHRNEGGRPLIALIKCSCAGEPLEKGFTLPLTLIHSLLLYAHFITLYLLFPQLGSKTCQFFT